MLADTTNCFVNRRATGADAPDGYAPADVAEP